MVNKFFLIFLLFVSIFSVKILANDIISSDFELKTNGTNVTMSTGSGKYLKFQITNLKEISRDIVITERSDLLKFDSNESINTWTINSFTSDSVYVGYYVDIPDNQLDGTYYEKFIINVGNIEKEYIVKITVKDNLFIRLYNALNMPVFENEVCMDDFSVTKTDVVNITESDLEVCQNVNKITFTYGLLLTIFLIITVIITFFILKKG